MGEMVATMVEQCAARIDEYPNKLILYRDGAAESAYDQIIIQEVNGIRSKCAEVKEGCRPQIAYIIVQKRHRMRFFPLNDEDKDSSENCVPGLMVDSTVTHPYDFDFSLMGHPGLLGTSRACRHAALCKL